MVGMYHSACMFFRVLEAYLEGKQVLESAHLRSSNIEVSIVEYEHFAKREEDMGRCIDFDRRKDAAYRRLVLLPLSSPTALKICWCLGKTNSKVVFSLPDAVIAKCAASSNPMAALAMQKWQRLHFLTLEQLLTSQSLAQSLMSIRCMPEYGKIWGWKLNFGIRFFQNHSALAAGGGHLPLLQIPICRFLCVRRA